MAAPATLVLLERFMALEGEGSRRIETRRWEITEGLTTRPWAAEEGGSMRFAAGISRHRSIFVFIILAGIAAVWLAQRPVGAQTTEHVFWAGPGGNATFLNVNQPGLQLGDRLAAKGPLLDASQTNQVGRLHLDCVIMNKITEEPVEDPRGLYWCTYLLRLADGDLTIGGLDPRGPSVSTFAVLGGTGAYAVASGEATLTDSDAGTEFVINLA